MHQTGWQVPLFYAGNALAFDGTDDVVTIADDNSLHIAAGITLEALVYATKSSGIQNVISKSNNTTNTGYIFPRTDDGWANVTAYLFIGGGWQTLSAAYPSLNAWHHLAMTYDGITMRLYIDGIQKATKPMTGIIAINTNSLALGNQPGFSENFGGYADELRVWNVVRTPAQILSAMNTELNPATQTGLVSYYTLNQGNAAGLNTGLKTVMDQKGNNNGTLVNFGFSGGSSNFVTQYTSLALLPVSWLGFTAQKQDSKILLNWSTSSEQNTRRFIVQHSMNATDWTSIGNLQAAGNSVVLEQYSFVHNNPVNGTNYYRIQLEDIDGKISYSKTISVVYAGQQKQVMLYANPVTDKTIRLQLLQPATVFIYNNTGELVLISKQPAGMRQINVNGFAKGIYQLKAAAESIRVVLQ